MASMAVGRSPMLFQCQRLIARTAPHMLRRTLFTLPNAPYIYAHEQPNNRYILSLLPDEPPIASLAIGTAFQIPPKPETFNANEEIMRLVNDVIREHAAQDPDVQAQAAMYSSQAGSTLGSGGHFFPQQQHLGSAGKKRKKTTNLEYGGGGGGGGAGGAGGASAQGGMGGAGRGGYIHVSDQRNPPDFGRVAWPEDIFGSLELTSAGNFVDGNGRYQASNTYRICTNEGILGLSPFLRGKLVERLQELAALARKNA